MTCKILVVDDEPDVELLVRQHFRRRIRDKELEFVFAQNGDEALTRLEQHSDVDLVLSDINMPVMDGLALLAKLSESNGTRKTVIISAYGDLRNIRAAMNRGAYDFLIKPIDFEDLETTVNKTLSEILRLKEAARNRDRLLRIEQELGVAHQIQQSLLPREFPTGRPEFSIFARSNPSREVGGDFYDFFPLEGSALGLVIGDVSGKGVPAALFMAVSQTLLRATARLGLSPGQCLAYLNRTLVGQSFSSMFVTLFYAILDTATGKLTYSIGGHNPPYRFRAGGEMEQLAGIPGLVVGALDGSGYEDSVIELQPGDGLLLYTDGVPEAEDGGGDFFSEARLEALLKQYAAEPVEQIVNSILDQVSSFSGNGMLADDTTVMAVRYSGLPRA